MEAVWAYANCVLAHRLCTVKMQRLTMPAAFSTILCSIALKFATKSLFFRQIYFGFTQAARHNRVGYSAA